MIDIIVAVLFCVLVKKNKMLNTSFAVASISMVNLFSVVWPRKFLDFGMTEKTDSHFILLYSQEPRQPAKC